MLKQRIITALILAPIVLAGVFLLPLTEFSAFIGIVILIGSWEWAGLAGYSGYARVVYVAMLIPVMVLAWMVPPLYVLVPGVLWWLVATYMVISYGNENGNKAVPDGWIKGLIGIFVLIPAWIALIELKQRPDNHYLILLLFFLIWGADIGAYFAGKAFGKKKLAPRVSPGKSWAGAIGGLITAALIFVLMSFWRSGDSILNSLDLDWFLFLLACVFVVCMSVIGDLTESLFKRERGVKDSSQLLPGHGGVLDRIDSLVAAGPYFALFVLFLQ